MSENSTIAKNTLLLYGRMLLTLGISLYTSRIILRTLGVEDFGLYNLIAGVVILFSFLNSAMSSSTQRFLNIEIASRLKKRIQAVFSMSVNVHFLIACAVFVLSETLGLWFMNTKLNIPEDRMHAANIVYQLSIFTTFIEILKVPYDALVLAYERVSFYAIASIIETLIRLVIVLSIAFAGWNDKLVLYAFLIALMKVSSNIAFYYYCRTNFTQQVKYRYKKNPALFRDLITFSGWSLLGQISVVSASQGINLILNVFIGVVVNAALGIAGQVAGAVFSFISNAQTAFNPQIVQSFAEHRRERHINLVLRASKFSFYLFSVVCIPFLVGTQFILNLWLGPDFPKYSIEFTRLILMTSVVTSLAGPLWMSAYAVGNIKHYQILVSICNLLILPLAYFIIQKDQNPAFVLTAKLALDSLLLVFRIYYFKKTLRVERREIIAYITGVAPVFVFLFAVSFLSQYLLVDRFSSLIIHSFLFELFAIGMIRFWGLGNEEAANIWRSVKSKFLKLVG